MSFLGWPTCVAIHKYQVKERERERDRERDGGREIKRESEREERRNAAFGLIHLMMLRREVNEPFKLSL